MGKSSKWQRSTPSALALPPKLAVANTTATVAVQELPDPATVHQALAATAAALTEESLILLEWGNEPIQAEVQVIRIGEAALVALPGKPFTELGLTIKARSPVTSTWVVG